MIDRWHGEWPSVCCCVVVSGTWDFEIKIQHSTKPNLFFGYAAKVRNSLVAVRESIFVRARLRVHEDMHLVGHAWAVDITTVDVVRLNYTEITQPFMCHKIEKIFFQICACDTEAAHIACTDHLGQRSPCANTRPVYNGRFAIIIFNDKITMTVSLNSVVPHRFQPCSWHQPLIKTFCRHFEWICCIHLRHRPTRRHWSVGNDEQ